MHSLPDDWDPRSPGVLADPLRAYDALRARCPVAHSEYLHWSVFRHADVARVLHEPETFGNAVSRHLSIPNGIDAPEHGPWRALVERYFAPQRVAAFEPAARAVARSAVQALPAGEVEWMEGFAQDCAVRLLCAFMQWPQELHGPLREWTRRSQAATLAGDREALGALALEFDGHIRGQLDARRAQAQAGDDPTSRLLRDSIDGRPLRDEEIVGIVRNWTAGELSTLAASLGILAQYLAAHPGLQARLRTQPALLPPAIDEILRIHPPLLSNRRVVRQPACLGGREFAAGERLTLMWASANRDETVFPEPEAFRLDRDPALNLLYGAGVHVCPGADLSRLQLAAVTAELLAGTRSLAMVPGREPVPARYPVGGWSEVVLAVERI